MKALFMSFALLQTFLFVILEIGVKHKIIKNDLIVKFTKLLTIIIGGISLYIATI